MTHREAERITQAQIVEAVRSVQLLERLRQFPQSYASTFAGKVADWLTDEMALQGGTAAWQIAFDKVQMYLQRTEAGR